MKHDKKRVEIDIRPADVDDADAIEKLEKASFGDNAWPHDIIESYLLTSMGDPQKVPCFVAFAKAANGEEKIAGYTIGCMGGKEQGMVLDLAVSSEFKGLHLGRQLLEKVSDSLKAAGASELQLEVETTNKAAIALYESVGFVKDHLMPDYYGEHRDAFWMTTKPARKAPRPK